MDTNLMKCARDIISDVNRNGYFGGGILMEKQKYSSSDFPKCGDRPKPNIWRGEMKQLKGSPRQRIIYNEYCATTPDLLYSRGGGTQIWKWRTSAYRRTKIGGIQCKISSKKGGHSVWAPKKWGLFWCGLPKMGVIQCAKLQFQGKICNFQLKLPQNR